MSAREEVARLLAEHATVEHLVRAPRGLEGWVECPCGWSSGRIRRVDRFRVRAEHLAEVLDQARLLAPPATEHRHKAFVFHGAPADLPCQVCGETGWSTPSAEAQKNLADALADAGRYELERMKRERDGQP